MASIAEIRQKYPQYDDMDDGQLADAMYRAHYSDMPREQFNASIGIKAASKAEGPSAVVDVARSLPGGVAKGVTGLVGGPSSLMNLASNVGRKLTGREWVDDADPAAATFMGIPTTGQLNKAVSAPFDGFYLPRTTAGEYAETGASFLPAALFPGSLPMRAARVAVPAGASEAAGQFTKGTPIEPYARFGGALLGGGVTELAPTVARAGTRLLNRGVSAVTDGRVQVLNPVTEAERRLRESMLADGGPRAAVNNAASFARSGASTPSLIDIGGGSTRRLVRAAAGGGDEAHNIATRYADRVRANLQDEAAGHVRRLAPGETRTAGRAADDFEVGQNQLAAEQYRAPYSEPAVVNRDMVSALQGPEGRGAIANAFSDARANRDLQAMGELQDLMAVAAEQAGGRNPLTGQIRSLEQALTELSAGSLDRVRIAMRETGRGLQESGRNYRARGYFGRVRDIDSALDQTPGLVPARAAYRQMQSQRDAVPLGQQILERPSGEYADEIADLASVGGPPNIGAGLRVGARDTILGAVERPAAGQTGVLNRLGTSTGLEQNLSNTFGRQRTQVFQEAIRNEVQRLRNANFVSPETGSQTQLRQLDEGLMGGIPTSVSQFLSRIADKFFRGVSLTPAERAEIVRLGTSEADLRRFATARPRPSAPRGTLPTIQGSSANSR